MIKRSILFLILIVSLAFAADHHRRVPTVDDLLLVR
jgi:hypothetical protein